MLKNHQAKTARERIKSRCFSRILIQIPRYPDWFGRWRIDASTRPIIQVTTWSRSTSHILPDQATRVHPPSMRLLVLQSGRVTPYPLLHPLYSCTTTCSLIYPVASPWSLQNKCYWFCISANWFTFHTCHHPHRPSRRTRSRTRLRVRSFPVWKPRHHQRSCRKIF